MIDIFPNYFPRPTGIQSVRLRSTQPNSFTSKPERTGERDETRWPPENVSKGEGTGKSAKKRSWRNLKSIIGKDFLFQILKNVRTLLAELVNFQK